MAELAMGMSRRMAMVVAKLHKQSNMKLAAGNEYLSQSIGTIASAQFGQIVSSPNGLSQNGYGKYVYISVYIYV